VKRVFFASVAVLAAVASAHAQTDPAPPQAAEPEAAPEPAGDEDPIVVQAPSDQARIDRRTYTIRNDPAAQSTDMLDVLGRIPAVSVTPTGEVTLLGAGSVTVQINGQPVPGGSLEQILQSLQGGQVERIEVISNPSAQFAAQSSGGVINIVTRRRQELGASGSATIGVNSAQGYVLNVGPSWSRGPWSASLWAGLNHNESDRDSSRVRRDLSGNLLTADEGVTERTFDAAFGWLQLGYDPQGPNKFSLSANLFRGEPTILTPLLRSNAAGPLLSQLTVADNAFTRAGASFDFEREGDQEREKLTFNLALDHRDRDEAQTVSQTPLIGTASRFHTTSENAERNLSSKLEYETPLGESRFLSLGAALDRRDYEAENNLTTVLGAPSAADFASSLSARDETLAVFGTLQIEAGAWTILPGLRVEQYRREVTGLGGATDATATKSFPTLHLRRALSDWLDLDLSYSRRIDRPDLEDLDPTIRVLDSTRALSGNPNLQPTTTQAYEANLNWQRRGRTISLTAFYRRSDDVASEFNQQIGPLTLSTQVNAGQSEQRGLQAILRGPFGEGWRYSLSANALNNEFDAMTGAGLTRRSEFQYSGNAQIEYRDPDQARVGADNFALDMRFSGPSYSLQGQTDAAFQANITWRRRLAPRVFGVLIIQDVFSSQDNIATFTTDAFSERNEQSSQGARLRLALTYQWGAGSDRMQERQAPGETGS
jgi:outer membrane receptor protein involved in Fe transport